jgi:Mn-dependent DtxR family transcriptional regulator
MTKVSKAIDLLAKQGLTLTQGELAQRLQTTGDSVRSIISQVRRKGYPVYCNEGGFDSKGRQRKSRYRVGKASREMVAAYYATA